VENYAGGKRSPLGDLPEEEFQMRRIMLSFLPLRGIEWVILAWFRGSVFFFAILLFDRHHPSVPTCTRDLPARAAAVKDGPAFGPPRQRREASLTAASTTA